MLMPSALNTFIRVPMSRHGMVRRGWGPGVEGGNAGKKPDTKQNMRIMTRVLVSWVTGRMNPLFFCLVQDARKAWHVTLEISSSSFLHDGFGAEHGTSTFQISFRSCRHCVVVLPQHSPPISALIDCVEWRRRMREGRGVLGRRRQWRDPSLERLTIPVGHIEFQ